MFERTKSPTKDALIDSTAEWLMSKALEDVEVREIFGGCCDRLGAAGIPISRAFLYYRTLHPLYATVVLVWQRGSEDVRVQELPHERAFTSEEWLQSPMNHLLQSDVPHLRRRLSGPDAVIDFTILDQLRSKGGTDYLGYFIPFSGEESVGPNRDGMLGSWSTERESGFTENDIRDLKRIQKRLAVACKMQIRREITRNVLTAYLGDNAGQHVLDGQIKRGDGRRVSAVIWYSDLRGSTELANSLEDDDYLDLLNRYFECSAGAVLACGGEVLSFIGDAVLAIFPVNGDPAGGRSAAEAALKAAHCARERLAALNATRPDEAPINFGLGLHVGNVMHGNIGVPERVEFSVIGPAVNEVARLEELTKVLKRDLLVSGAFANLIALAWEDLGVHSVRGSEQTIAVHAPPKAG